MLDICLNIGDGEQINVEALKKSVKELSKGLTDIDKDEQFNPIRDQVKAKSLVQVKAAPKPAAAPAPAAPADDKDKGKDKDAKADDKKEEAKK